MTIGLGMIGYAGIASRIHLPVLTHLPDVRVVAIAGTRKDPLTAVADRYAIPARYGDYRSLLEDPRVEAVAICVPPALHEPIGLAALKANKHVFMEKPLALSLEQCSRLMQAAESLNVTTMVGFHLRWHRLVQEACAWMSAGRLGSVELLRTVFTSGIGLRTDLPTWRQRREAGGGVLIDSGVHYYDLWRVLATSEVDEVQVTNHSSGHNDRTAVVSGRMRNGMLASATFCQGTADSLEIEMYGSAGRLRISGYALDGFCFEPSGVKGMKKILSKVRCVPHRFLRAARAIPLKGYYLNAYRNQWTGFLTAIKNGRPAGASFADGLEATRVALAATQAAHSGRTVRMTDCADAIAPVRGTENGHQT